jgi:SSS family transporter
MVWRLNLSQLKRDANTDVNSQSNRWQQVASWPDDGPRRMFAQVTVQHDGFGDRLYVLGGRRFVDGSDTSDLRNLQACSDCWSFDPAKFDAGVDPWKRLADSPKPLTAGTAVPYGPAYIIVPGAATMEILHQVVDSGTEMRDFNHPGFPRTTYAYHTVTDTWFDMGDNEGTQVTTPAIRWGDDIFLVSGEIRPRVRTNKVWRIKVKESKRSFGAINMAVVIAYLLAMVGVGAWFTFRNQSTDDYFRGGKQIPWWAAGCSIFATMLSSITYMAVPAKAFAQDWVYAVGNLLILAVAPIAIYVALPFFRRIDATSAYEYLEKRFNRTVRLIGSGSFSLFHIFRMGVVLALAALALASITPLTPAQCVLVMGALSIIYCTLGGVEAVIWTDTIQTFVLIGGAILCLYFAIQGSDPGSFSAASEAGKFHMVNIDFGPASFTTMAIWVVVIGGFGQNLASYTADQAVVQRYMTTSDEKMAAKSIWLNGWMAIPAAALFFGMGTAFWMFYRSNPEKLDPTIASDRIMPLFISQELPIGLAGLVVAGIFAAAQSTVSTSMNSGATTIVTDFLRPLSICKSERSYLWLARIVTLVMGVFGTAAGLLFVDPDIKSLFDQFIGILGMFLGVLAGLFALGATTRNANGPGSLVGAFISIAFMIAIVFAANDKQLFGLDFRSVFDSVGMEIYKVSGYLYAFIGIAICYVVGLIASYVLPGQDKDLDGLVLLRSRK